MFDSTQAGKNIAELPGYILKEKGIAGVKPYLPFMEEKDIEKLLDMER